MLYVAFLLLRESKVLHLQRVKNKFFDPREPPNIRTNVLVNVWLLYPNTEEEFVDYQKTMQVWTPCMSLAMTNAVLAI